MNPSLTPAPSCTSKPCVWNVPRKRKVDNLPIVQVKFKKHQHGKPVKSEDKSSSTSDARPQHQHHAHSNTTLCNLLHSVREVEKKTDKKMALSLILPQKTLEEVKDSISVEHSYCAPLTPIEDAILSEYMKSKKLDNQNVIVKPCGLFVSKSPCCIS